MYRIRFILHRPYYFPLHFVMDADSNCQPTQFRRATCLRAPPTLIPLLSHPTSPSLREPRWRTCPLSFPRSPGPHPSRSWRPPPRVAKSAATAAVACARAQWMMQCRPAHREQQLGYRRCQPRSPNNTSGGRRSTAVAPVSVAWWVSRQPALLLPRMRKMTLPMKFENA